MTISRLTLAAALLGTLALPALAQPAARHHVRHPVKARVHQVAATSPAVTAPATATTPAAIGKTSAATPATTMGKAPAATTTTPASRDRQPAPGHADGDQPGHTQPDDTQPGRAEAELNA